MPEPEQPEDHWRGMGHSRVVRGQPVEEEEGDGERSSVASSSGSGGFDYKIKPNGEVEPIGGGEEEEEEEEEEGEEEKGEGEVEEGFLEDEHFFPEPIVTTLEKEYEPTKNVGGIIVVVFKGIQEGLQNPTITYGGSAVNSINQINQGSAWGVRMHYLKSPPQGKRILKIVIPEAAIKSPYYVWVRIIYNLVGIDGTSLGGELKTEEANSDRIEKAITPAKKGTLFVASRRNYKDLTTKVVPVKLAEGNIPYAPAEGESNNVMARGVITPAQAGQLLVISTKWPTLISGSLQQSRLIGAVLLSI